MSKIKNLFESLREYSEKDNIERIEDDEDEVEILSAEEVVEFHDNANSEEDCVKCNKIYAIMKDAGIDETLDIDDAYNELDDADKVKVTAIIRG